MSDQSLAREEIRQHAVFRAILQAMSRPGSVQPLPGEAAGGHLPKVVDCLFDNEVGVCMAAPDATLAEHISRKWNARLVEVADADFLIAPHGCSHGLLESLPCGTPDYPDHSATVIFQVESFADGGVSVELTGPGIPGSVRSSFRGLDSAELTALRRVNCEFPLGVDAIFVSRSGEVLCIPRSSRIGD